MAATIFDKRLIIAGILLVVVAGGWLFFSQLRDIFEDDSIFYILEDRLADNGQLKITTRANNYEETKGLLQWRYDTEKMTLLKNNRVLVRSKWLVRGYSLKKEGPDIINYEGNQEAKNITVERTRNYNNGVFTEVTTIDPEANFEQFPSKHIVDWKPTSIYKHRVTWRLERVEFPESIVHGVFEGCEINTTNNVKINWCKEKGKVEYAFVDLEGKKVSVYFKFVAGDQNFDISVVDPVSHVSGSLGDLTNVTFNSINLEVDPEGLEHSLSKGNLTLTTDGNGLVAIYVDGVHLGRFGFSLFKTIDGTKSFSNSWETNWNWSILSNTDQNITVQANTSWDGWNWTQLWFVSPTDEKLLHIISNNTGFDSFGTQLFYVVDINSENVPFVTYTDNQGIDQNFSFDSNVTITDNIEQYATTIDFANAIFNFQDLVDTGFDFNYLFGGNLNAAHSSLPNTKGFIVGITKNNGFFPDGATVVLDPTVTTNLLESTNLDVFDPASPNIFRVNSANLGFIAHPAAVGFFARYYETIDNGLTWSEADFNFFSGGNSNDSPGIVFNSDNNKVVLVYNFVTRMYAQEGDHQSPSK